MKLASDPRHKLRRKLVQRLYSSSFAKNEENLPQNTEEINKIIAKAAPEWPIEKINKIDLAILRLAIWELNEGKAPKKVVIDEAIELAKEYGSESSSSFVNGVLGKVLKTIDKK